MIWNWIFLKGFRRSPAKMAGGNPPWRHLSKRCCMAWKQPPDVLFWKMRDAIISPGRVELMVEVWNLQLVERLIVQSVPLAAKKRMIPLHCMI